MGLCITNNVFAGHYSEFGSFRRHLSKLTCIGDLTEYFGHGGTRKFPSPKQEPLVLLFKHSDCCGDLTAEACGKISARLSELLDDIEVEFVETAKRMLGGLEDAAQRGIGVEFC